MVNASTVPPRRLAGGERSNNCSHRALQRTFDLLYVLR